MQTKTGHQSWNSACSIYPGQAEQHLQQTQTAGSLLALNAFKPSETQPLPLAQLEQDGAELARFLDVNLEGL